ncbi:hypothetical protein RF11_08253 [Thelohanellus kitauei]|uniref:Serpin domain-containing protein n=1 Tax=Thelohanellus kitauei TaxID=669202 RepID=A0A0C2NI18_THEKT|nr:hypothetical protein RF11_08253 [Thelohanellus kitauei]
MEVPFHYIIYETLPADLKLLIINEYFVGFKFMNSAKKKYSKRSTFIDKNNRKIKVTMMRMVDFFRFFNDTQLKASVFFIDLTLNGTYAALVVPHNDNNPKNIVNNLNV